MGLHKKPPIFARSREFALMSHNTQETVAILDAGAQFAKVIDRKVRELKVKTEILSLATPASELVAKGVKAIIISGKRPVGES